MMLALLLVGLVDWSSGPQIAVVDSSGIADHQAKAGQGGRAARQGLSASATASAAAARCLVMATGSCKACARSCARAQALDFTGMCP